MRRRADLGGRPARLPVLLCVLALAGCASTSYPAAGPSASPGPTGGVATATDAGPSSASSPTEPTRRDPARPGPTAPVGDRPVIGCLNGTYRLGALLDAGATAAYPSGRGGDVELVFSGEEFPDGNYVGTRYLLRAAGRKPMTLTTADGSTRSLRTTAEAQGGYTLEGSDATFVRAVGTGSGRLTGGDHDQDLTLPQVLAVVGPVGRLTVSCSGRTLWLTGDTRQLTLTGA